MKISRAICLGVMLALTLFAGACKEQEMAKPSGPDAPEAGARIEGYRYLDLANGLYWFKPVGFSPMEPGAGEDFGFGWRQKKTGMEARLWVLSASWRSDLVDLANGLAADKGWQLSEMREIAWQGRRAVDVLFSHGDRAGRLRLIEGKGVVAVAAEAPAGLAKKQSARLVMVIERLRLIPPGDVLHTVKRANETLNMVSLWYTGMSANWPKIKQYNKLKDSHLSTNQEILIPADLVWRQDPMPPWAYRLMSKKARGKKAKAAEDEEADDLELAPTGPK